MKTIFFFLLLNFSLGAKTNAQLNALFCSLDPLSVAQNFAFYELYPESVEGKKALQKTWQLLSQDTLPDKKIDLPSLDLRPIISLVNKENITPPSLNEEQTQFIRKLAAHLPNRKLQGYLATKEEEILDMASDEIDMCRALFLSQDKGSKEQMTFYESTIDLMALQIIAKLPENPTPEDKIQAINQFIFHEMHFRFPPHSLWAKDVDMYTFLPSVIDSRKGVCLGVSILYLCIAQRLDLPLEIITPPGHIYVRYREKDKTPINIETTARGINTPSKLYLGIETKSLEKRTLKETVGLAFINQASVCWMQQNYAEAVHLYEKAIKYLPNDPLLQEFLGLNYLFVGDIKKGEKLLFAIKDILPPHSVSKDTIVSDYLEKKADIEALKTIFTSVDADRSSIIEKKELLEKTVKKFPKFRAALFQLAGTWLQLGREKEAKKVLEDYEKIDPNDPTVNYYLSILCMQRMLYKQAWHYFKKTKELLSTHDHFPQALQDLQRNLIQVCPTFR